ncbi:MAG: hypothetical protein GY906_15720 [bacterium]|nr:hypothetical protein [bacterium]
MGKGDRPKSPDTSRDAGLNLRPRVVILNEGRTHCVEVLKLPADASKGDAFRHHGTLWRVTGLRKSSQVLMAEPE